jgi:hypothetical protein
VKHKTSLTLFKCLHLSTYIQGIPDQLFGSGRVVADVASRT